MTDKDKNVVIQIIKQYELIYILKIVVFIFMAIIAIVALKETSTSNSKYLGVFTLMLSTAIDLVVLSKNSDALGKIDGILLVVWVFLLFMIFGLVLSVFSVAGLDKCAMPFSVMGALVCCLSPGLEVIYDTELRLQQQNKKQEND